MYDITNRWSFDGIDRWIKEIDEVSSTEGPGACCLPATPFFHTETPLAQGPGTPRGVWGDKCGTKVQCSVPNPREVPPLIWEREWFCCGSLSSEL